LLVRRIATFSITVFSSYLGFRLLFPYTGMQTISLYILVADFVKLISSRDDVPQHSLGVGGASSGMLTILTLRV